MLEKEWDIDEKNLYAVVRNDGYAYISCMW